MGYHNSCSMLLILMLQYWMLTPISSADLPASSIVLQPNCTQKCGKVTIPYPFGIEDGCYYVDKDDPNDYMKVLCNYSTNPPMPILGSNLEIWNISLLDGEICLYDYISYNCYNQGQSIASESRWVSLVSLTLSSTKNLFVTLGCDTYAWFTGFRHGKRYYTGCMTQCDNLADVSANECDGVGCCTASIPDGVTNITTTVGSFSNHSSVEKFNPCSAAFPVAKDTFEFSRNNLTNDEKFYLGGKKLPIVFNWAIMNKNCSISKADGSCLCKDNTDCYDSEPDQNGYRCKCKDGYSGNPYLPQGCQDVNECEEANNDCEKAEYCTNTNGSYLCQCPKGYHGNGTKTPGCVSNAKSWLTPVIITAAIGGSIIIFLMLGFLLHWRRGERQLKNLRESFFRQNGGMILHERLSTRDDLKIFTTKDLEIATENYNDMHIIGRGGFGIVYKGTLPNNQEVAIKRSLKIDPDQVEQFINEVLLLSQINNRNIVKLIGCCLETEVPLLVYEFINNGTLYEHLEDRAKASLLTWPMRLRIASEIAEVLSYLHTTISTPIVHRDMKTMNVLLDESYTAKVTDFGASRLVPSDQGQLATMVLGTWGYLDPEYMQTSELTDKSDVYSFGVVLIELLTRKKVISNDRPEVERCLSMHFLVKMKEDRLFDIVDKVIANGGEIEQIEQVANLAKCCLRLKGEERPSMREVALELEGIKRGGKHYSWHNVAILSTVQEQDSEYLLQGMVKDNGGHSGGNDSDLYNVDILVSPFGDGNGR